MNLKEVVREQQQRVQQKMQDARQTLSGLERGRRLPAGMEELYRGELQGLELAAEALTLIGQAAGQAPEQPGKQDETARQDAQPETPDTAPGVRVRQLAEALKQARLEVVAQELTTALGQRPDHLSVQFSLDEVYRWPVIREAWPARQVPVPNDSLAATQLSGRVMSALEASGVLDELYCLLMLAGRWTNLSLEQIETLAIRVEGSAEAARKWMHTPQPELSGCTPAQAVQRGDADRVVGVAGA